MNMSLSKLQASDVKTYVNLTLFIETHCKSSCYAFQIKKCRDDTCPFCSVLQPIRLPAEIFNQLSFLPDPELDISKEHYKTFNTLYGTETTEKDQPSLHFSLQATEKDKNNKELLVSERVHDVIKCSNCF